jgi:hypothetical protein
MGLTGLNGMLRAERWELTPAYRTKVSLVGGWATRQTGITVGK